MYITDHFKMEIAATLELGYQATLTELKLKCLYSCTVSLYFSYPS